MAKPVPLLLSRCSASLPHALSLTLTSRKCACHGQPRAPSATTVFHHCQLRLRPRSASCTLAEPPGLKLPCHSRCSAAAAVQSPTTAIAQVVGPSPAAPGRAATATAFPCLRCPSHTPSLGPYRPSRPVALLLPVAVPTGRRCPWLDHLGPPPAKPWIALGFHGARAPLRPIHRRCLAFRDKESGR
jgi:hypothetical protein